MADTVRISLDAYLGLQTCRQIRERSFLSVMRSSGLIKGSRLVLLGATV